MKKSSILLRNGVLGLAMMGMISYGSAVPLFGGGIMEVYASSVLQIMQQPSDVSVVVGKSTSFTVKADGNGLKYQWQVKFPGQEWKNAGAPSAKTATYSFTVNEAHNGMQVRCVVTDESGRTATSSTAACQVNKTLAITGQPSDVRVENGKTASFTVKAEGSGLKYQWQVKFPGQEWKNAGAPSAKTATYSFTVNEAHNGMQVRCSVIDENGKQTITNEVKLFVLHGEDWELPIM